MANRPGRAAWTTLCGAVLFLLTAGGAQAATVSGVTLQPSGQGPSVRIAADQKMNYEVFDLSDPARVVLSLPGAKLAPGVEPVKTASGAVNAVFPVQTAQGVRIEIGLGQKQPYKVVEQGNDLLVRFAASARIKPKAKAVQAKIKDIQVYDSGSVTELVLHGEHMNASHDAFLTNKGRTMILDYWGASSLLPKDHYTYATQRVSGVTVGQAPGRVRLVISLLPAEQSKYQVQATKDTMVLRFGNVIPKKKATQLVVDSVDFQPEDRIAHIVVRTDQVNPVINLRQKDGNVFIDVRKATLAAGQQRTQDVRAFPGPVKQIDSYRVDDHVHIVARLREKVELSSFQQGNVLTVTLMPEDIAQARAGGASQGERFAYSGQKVTFDFQDIDIRNALRLIAEMSKLNIIMSDDVKGKLTMRLVDVPWDQALDLILAAEGLGKEQMGNVIRIAPISVLQAEYKAKLAAQQGSDQLEPLVTQFITLSYTKVADVKKMLDNASANATRATTGSGGTSGTAPASSTSTSGQASGNVGILSPRGSFLIDERTNTLIIKDTQESIDNVKRLIAAIDKPVQQVLIESRIVEATENFSRSFGIRWGGYGTKSNVNSNTFTIGGTQGSSSPTSTTKNVATGDSGFVVDMPAATYAAGSSGGAIGMVLGGLTKAFNLSLELSAAENNGDAKVISNPRLITSNLKPAMISQGVSIPVTTPATNTTPATVQYKQADLSLTVTPQITADDKVIMDIKVTKDAPNTTINPVSGTPGIDTKTIQTTAFLANGETVVIGGIYTKQTGNTVNKVPGLGDIPILGWLFKNKAVNDNRSELLIFLTPTIIKPVSSQGSST